MGVLCVLGCGKSGGGNAQAGERLPAGEEAASSATAREGAPAPAGASSSDGAATPEAPAADGTAASPGAAPGEGVPLPPFDPARPIALLPPRLDGGVSLMAALARRRSSRAFAPEPLDLRLLSDLLWAATGVNRGDTGQRTAPTARDRRDLDVYAATAGGLFRYDVEHHALVPIAPQDVRALTGMQDFVATAPLDLIYVSDLAKVAGENREDKLVFAGSHAGFVSQNVYLFCASAGLSTVVRASIDKPKLAEALRLRPDQLIVLSQTVGFPGPVEPTH